VLRPSDHAQLLAEGRDPADVEAQLRLLAGEAPRTRLVRPATVGDGIHRLIDVDRLAASGREVADRLSWFIPASGAATRMSAAVVRAWRGEPLSAGEAAEVEAIVAGAGSLAMWPAMAARGASLGDRRSVLAALVGPDSVGVDRLPKGLVPFHRGPRGARTPVAAHLVEAQAVVGGGQMRAHLTVQAAWRAAFEAEVSAAAAREGVDAAVSLSVQDPATDTPSLGADGQPVRDASGRLVFRPGGHGALLRNLAAWGGDLVMLRNVDNVTPESDLAEAARWRLALVGALRAAQADPAAWGVSPLPGRPWRAAGMVRNEGQPGGGPFWAHSPDGVRLQIVESAQVGAQDAAILGTSTHFNPVDLVLDVAGADLTACVDPDAVIVTEKVQGGLTTRVLERPGLWNGGMARWNTVFVEIPAALFRPVKTLADLLAG
jgi:hypothetical protein